MANSYSAEVKIDGEWVKRWIIRGSVTVIGLTKKDVERQYSMTNP